jgi:hypothetical protein
MKNAEEELTNWHENVIEAEQSAAHRHAKLQLVYI